MFEINDHSFELSVYDEMSIGVIDILTKALEALLKKVKCSLSAIDELLSESDLSALFQKIKGDVKKILQNDVKKCIVTEGLTDKLK